MKEQMKAFILKQTNLKITIGLPDLRKGGKILRSISHLTPRYIVNRILVKFYEVLYPTHPWLTKTANSILDTYLLDSDIGLEFGSGRSTIWFAKRVKHLISIEPDKTWHQKVQQEIHANKLNNVDYYFIPQEISKTNSEYLSSKNNITSYLEVAKKLKNNSLDFVLIDGLHRDHTTLAVIEKIKPGGLLIIDNSNWDLPSQSYSPSSRSFDQGPKGEIWKEVYKIIFPWRKIWTSSGVTDTTIFFKPYTDI